MVLDEHEKQEENIQHHNGQSWQAEENDMQ